MGQRLSCKNFMAKRGGTFGSAASSARLRAKTFISSTALQMSWTIKRRACSIMKCNEDQTALQLCCRVCQFQVLDATLEKAYLRYLRKQENCGIMENCHGAISQCKTAIPKMKDCQRCRVLASHVGQQPQGFVHASFLDKTRWAELLWKREIMSYIAYARPYATYATTVLTYPAGV